MITKTKYLSSFQKCLRTEKLNCSLTGSPRISHPNVSSCGYTAFWLLLFFFLCKFVCFPVNLLPFCYDPDGFPTGSVSRVLFFSSLHQRLFMSCWGQFGKCWGIQEAIFQDVTSSTPRMPPWNHCQPSVCCTCSWSLCFSFCRSPHHVRRLQTMSWWVWKHPCLCCGKCLPFAPLVQLSWKNGVAEALWSIDVMIPPLTLMSWTW